MIFPQLAKQAEVTSLTSYIEDDNWVMEQKLDGHRVLLCSPGRDMPPTALTRNGTLYTRKLPKAVQDFRFPEGDWILDGELVGDTFYVFDLPKHPDFDYAMGDNLNDLLNQGREEVEPLWLRRTILENLLDNISHPFKLVPQARTPQEKISLAEISLKNNYEGLVLKQKAAPYRSGGRTPEWLKVKYVKSLDAVVLAVRDDGKESVRLGIYRDGVLIDVGRASLIGKEKRGLIAPGDVLEVRYLYCNTPEAPRLYQPTILRRRDDKSPEECTDDQLRFTNKEVLCSL